MAKKKSQSTQTSSDLSLSSFHARFEQLQEDRQWLLKQIKRKQTELRNFLEQMRSIAVEILQRSQPFHEKLVQIDREIHALFEEIFATRKFGKKSRQKIEQTYQMLQTIGAISPKQDPEADVDEDSTDEEFFPFDSEDDSDFQSEFNSEFNSDRFHQEDNPPPNHENSKSSADLKQMRGTFLRLASIFHPDKVTDGENQSDYAEIMKEVNRAYEEGDLARLIEIERQYELNKSIDLENASQSEIEKQCDRLEKDNQMLKTQYEEIKSELRWMRRTPEGEMVKEYRSLVKEGFDPIEETISQAEMHLQELENIRNFVADFRNKKITIKQFLQGPTSVNRPSKEEMEELFEELVAEMIFELDL